MALRILYLASLAGVILTVAVSPAGAHQIASNNGVSVQVHVNPDDEPHAGVPTTVWVVRVKAVTAIRPKPVKPVKTTFTWATCRCRMKVFDSSGATVLDSSATGPKTPVTFPEAKAYGITFSGRVKRNGVWRPFKVSYAIRASASESAPE